MLKTNYSCLKASIGFKLAAFFAGKNPNTTPITVENTNDKRIIPLFKINGKSKALVTLTVIKSPNKTT